LTWGLIVVSIEWRSSLGVTEYFSCIEGLMSAQQSRSRLYLYATLRPPVVAAEPIPWLGTIAVLVLYPEPGLNRLFTMCRTLPPYIPLVAAADSTTVPLARERAADLDIQQARQTVVLPLRPGLLTATGALAAIGQRPPPDAGVMARWLTHRLIAPRGSSAAETAEREATHADLLQLIQWALDLAVETGEIPAGRTLRKRLARVLHCRPSDLKRLLGMTGQPRRQPGVEQLAAEAGTSAGRLRARVRSGLGLALRHYNELAGWEPVLEAAVRAGLGRPGWGIRHEQRAGEAARRKVTRAA
jgi:hypothetical protein